MSQNQISVQIRNREKLLLKDSIEALSSVNTKGPFDILPFHTNFISLIRDRIILHRNSHQQETITIKTGLLKVWENQISIYLDIESPLDQII